MADEPQRHHIEVACPECGHLQREPALVISTQCRACRAHFQVSDGKGVARVLSSVRLAKPRTEPEAPPAPAQPTPRVRYGPSAPKRRPWWQRLLQPDKPPREATCFQCGHSFTAIGAAQSSQCPKCGSYVNLLDYDITDRCKLRIQTCGNVTIQKTGAMVGATTCCHNLTVLGELAGDVECMGDLIIRSSGKITGTVQCRHLRVEKGAKVEFLHPVHAATATLDGQVRGQLSCTGAVVLEKRAQLHGLVRTSSLVVRAGAKHSGSIEMVTPPSPAS